MTISEKGFDYCYIKLSNILISIWQNMKAVLTWATKMFLALFYFTLIENWNSIARTSIAAVIWETGCIMYVIDQNSAYPWNPLPSILTTIHELGRQRSGSSNFRTYSNLLLAILCLYSAAEDENLCKREYNWNINQGCLTISFTIRNVIYIYQDIW